MRGLLCITVQETLSSTGKAISLHLLAVPGLQIVIVIFTVQTVPMARTKQTNGDLSLQHQDRQGGHLNGVQLHQG